MAGDSREESGGPPEDESRAIQACQAGDREAYSLLVRRYAARAQGVGRGILRDAALAEDAAQEAFVRAFRAIRRFDLNERFYPWFYRILRNVCFSLHKRRRGKESSLDVEGMPPIAAPAVDAAEPVERAELRARIDAALALLSEAHREIIVLSHFEEFSYKEIAATLSIPIGTVMSRLWAARRALKEKLGPYEVAADE